MLGISPGGSDAAKSAQVQIQSPRLIQDLTHDFEGLQAYPSHTLELICEQN
jgi:hypothetical protein